jgi:large subunit ribosomal protein L30
MAAEGKIRVRLVRSKISTTERQRETCLGLGLRKIGDSRVLEKTPAVLGMVKKVAHLVEVEESNVGG